MPKRTFIALALTGACLTGPTSASVPELPAEGVTKRMCSAFLAASNHAQLVAAAMQKMNLDANRLNELVRTTFGVAIADGGGHPYDEFDARRQHRLSDSEAKAFRSFFHSLLNGLLEVTNPPLSQTIHPHVFIATHPKANHQATVADLFDGEFKDSAKVLLVHADFPALEPRLFDSKPFAYYSSHGELPHIVARKATLGGGYLDDCLLSSARYFVLSSFHNPHIRHIDVEIRPSITYSRTADDSLKAEAARIIPEQLRDRIGDWLVHTIVEELNKATRKHRDDPDRFTLVDISIPPDLRGFEYSSTIRREEDMKTVTFTFSNR